ncbi:MAG: hypothetical protein J1F28_01710, partial [Oscillospiraceae bacterium]|nr:hypothetical protein [Oscillospiraceae bacterium]
PKGTFFKKSPLVAAKRRNKRSKALKGVGKTRVFPTFAFLGFAEKSKSAGKSAREPAGSLAIYFSNENK